MTNVTLLRVAPQSTDSVNPEPDSAPGGISSNMVLITGKGQVSTSVDVLFPDCLQTRDKAGTVRTRRTETEDGYRDRYWSLAARIAMGRPPEDVEVEEVADDLRLRAPELKVNSYYLYRAAVLQILRDRYSKSELTDEQAKRLIERMTPVEGFGLIGSLVTTTKTSANRRKSMSKITAACLVSVLRANPTATWQNLADMFECGPDLGLRPCEFFDATISGRIVTVRTAKYSIENQKGVAAYRTFELGEEFDAYAIEALQILFANLAIELEAVGGDRSRLVRRYGDALRAARREVPSAKNITLKTTRHQFRANLKRVGYTREEIAAAMGQASADTSSGYGTLTRAGGLQVADTRS
jgi:hypothetical protein